eukprot:365645-Chlamydomonas_euryale.AAC.6
MSRKASWLAYESCEPALASLRQLVILGLGRQCTWVGTTYPVPVYSTFLATGFGALDEVSCGWGLVAKPSKTKGMLIQHTAHGCASTQVPAAAPAAPKVLGRHSVEFAPTFKNAGSIVSVTAASALRYTAESALLSPLSTDCRASSVCAHAAEP